MMKYTDMDYEKAYKAALEKARKKHDSTYHPSVGPSGVYLNNADLEEIFPELKRRNNVPTNLYDKQEIIDLWKAGIEYGRNHPKQEQPEVDLEKEVGDFWDIVYGKDRRCTRSINIYDFQSFARHFYGLRNRDLEEAARCVYESWMGGTMDDVRRDMVELGRVINARKEE